MIVLAILFLVLLVTGNTLNLSARMQRRIILGENIIWGTLAADFILRLAVAHEKRAYLKANLFSGLALLFPPLRVLHAVRAIQLVAGAGRSGGDLRHLLRPGSVWYVATLTTIVVAITATSMFSIEQSAPGATITSISGALWWAGATVTTVGSEKYPVTNEGRILAVMLMLYSLAFAGYITAVLAGLILGQSQSGSALVPPAPAPDTAALAAQIEALRAEVAALRGGATAGENGITVSPADPLPGSTANA